MAVRWAVKREDIGNAESNILRKGPFDRRSHWGLAAEPSLPKAGACPNGQYICWPPIFRPEEADKFKLTNSPQPPCRFTV